MKNDQDVRSSVRSILDDTAAKGTGIPSIRAIRGMIGKGSLGTISEAVNSWRQEQLQNSGSLPQGFEENDARQVAESVWNVVQPILKRQIKAIEQKADARVAIERNEASKIREAAEDVLATAEEKDRRIASLTDQLRELHEKLAELQGALDETRRDNARLRADNAELRRSQEQALQEAAKATAALESTQKLLPFIDPKHLDKINAK